jgi:lipopolysaccharide export system ATP-binding protein
MKHILEVDSVRLSFNNRVILSDVFLKCETGKITGLLGRNGEGKTCLLNMIYGELATEERSIRFDNTSFTHAYKWPDLIRYLPQFNFFPTFLTLEKVFDDFYLEFSTFEKRFPEFSSRHRSRLKTLSGGQLRFVQTYIIVKEKTQFSLLDEPFTHLMPLQIEKMLELITEEKKNKGFLITDHLYKHIVDISDHLYLLTDGKTHKIKNRTDIEDLGYARL